MNNGRLTSYSEVVRRLYPDNAKKGFSACREVTFQITDGCNLRCSYCYEHHKGRSVMALDTGKKIVDYILVLYEKDEGDFVNRNTKAVILSFIGGEPLLEAHLIEQICDYWFRACWERGFVDLAKMTRISFATNGMSWFTPAAQHLIKKYHELMSVTVSIDGVRELHDLHRVDADGKGSFARAYAAFVDGKKYGWYNSKMTFVPESFRYIASSVIWMIEEGCREIACNYAYEPEYTAKDARALYGQLKQVSDYIIEHKLDVRLNILEEYIGNPSTDDQNYCGGTGNMLSFAPDGKAYPCIRYAPISVGEEKAQKMCLGDAEHGLYYTAEQQRVKAELDAITMTSQSPEKCLTCPVATGCGWCSGLNYELFGTANKRYTGICLAHKGRVLAACYYYNKRRLVLGDVAPKIIHLPKCEAEALLGKEVSAELFALEKYARESLNETKKE